jgi:hypothetical protein
MESEKDQRLLGTRCLDCQDPQARVSLVRNNDISIARHRVFLYRQWTYDPSNPDRMCHMRPHAVNFENAGRGDVRAHSARTRRSAG